MIAATVAVVLIAWWSGRSLAPRVLTLTSQVEDLGAAAPIAFILIYAAAVMALVPALMLTAVGGAVFGLVPGALYSFIGGTLGSTCAFLLGRHAARHLVEARRDRMPRLAAVERAVSARGRWIVFLMRLSPVTPFNLLNYILGLTRITWWDFAVAGIGSIPGEILASYGGKVAGEAMALAGQAAAPKSASYYVVLVGGLVATAVATFVVARTARRALSDV